MADLLELVAGPVAHGGHCVARHDGRVVFVRHTLPGERVRAVVTDRRAKLWRAEAVEILEASPDRVPSAWPAAGPGGVGGGELAHVSLEAQRRWKADVVSEQLRRMAGLAVDVTVQPLPAETGLEYRTRIDLVADPTGRLGMHGFRSHRVVPLDDMPLAVPEIAQLGLFSRRWAAGARLEVVAPSVGEPLVLVDGEPFQDRRRHVQETVQLDDGIHHYRVAAAGFWQVHRQAPRTLATAVITAVGAGGGMAGATVVDLYSGVGLFTLPLAQAVGATGAVWSVEGDAAAVRNARRNLHDQPHARLLTGDVGTVLSGLDARPDVVVLDPPRAGAKAAVVQRIAAMAPQRVVYVACDPAALARDVALFRGAGYSLAELSAFDLFPMTHHVECIAVLQRPSGSGAQ